MKTRMILAAIAIAMAAAAASTASAGDGVLASSAVKAEETCRLTTGAIRTNFGTLNGLSVSSRDPAAAIDYRCPVPVALLWSLVAPGASAGAGQALITTQGKGGILGIAGIEARAGESGRTVSVVVAP